MKNVFLISILSLFLLGFSSKEKYTIYKYEATDLQGKTIKLEAFKGKKIMIVNTASACGLTPQFKELESLYQKYKNQDFLIIGFPSNDFAGQEPLKNEEIAQFCEINYGVSFKMMEKISVKGEKSHPIYQFLTSKVLNGKENSEVKWNFQKYLIGKDGKLEKIISPKTSPLSEEVISWIEG